MIKEVISTKQVERYFYPAVFTYEPGQEIAVPTPLTDIDTQSNERVVLIDVYMPSIRQAHVNRSVNRTVTLPAWLNAAALEHNINFSKVLQDTLKSQLHLESAAK